MEQDSENSESQTQKVRIKKKILCKGKIMDIALPRNIVFRNLQEIISQRAILTFFTVSNTTRNSEITNFDKALYTHIL